MDVLAIAASGMQAAVARLEVSASNIAASGEETAMITNGQSGASAPAPIPMQQLVQFSLPDGGVGVQVGQASGEDLGLDLVTQMMALDQFKANAQVFQTGEEAMKTLLNLKA
jgi:flagellar basal body rod protein FlgC